MRKITLYVATRTHTLTPTDTAQSTMYRRCVSELMSQWTSDTKDIQAHTHTHTSNNQYG